jgi:hypothetical protein
MAVDLKSLYLNWLKISKGVVFRTLARSTIFFIGQAKVPYVDVPQPKNR